MFDEEKACWNYHAAMSRNISRLNRQQANPQVYTSRFRFIKIEYGIYNLESLEIK